MGFSREYFRGFRDCIDLVDVDGIDSALDVIYQAMRNGRTIYLAGDGGSAANASHAVCDLEKGITDIYPDAPIRAVSLSDNIATLTAYGNDDSFDVVYSRPLERHGEADDVLVLLSVSGSSPNLTEAARTARKKGMKLVGFLGKDGGKLRGVVDHPVVVPTQNYGFAETLHQLLCHMIKDYYLEARPMEDEKSDIPG